MNCIERAGGSAADQPPWPDRRSRGGDPAKFFEFDDKPPSQQVQYGKDCYFVAN